MLPLADKVTVSYQAEVGEGPDGDPITQTVTKTVPAAVWPLGSGETLPDLSGLGRFRMILDRSLGVLPAGASPRITWGSYDGVTLNKMTVDGTIDEVRVRGRIHHYELTTTAVV